MVLIFTNVASPRLTYISGFIFGELLGTQGVLTSNVNEYLQCPYAKINYSPDALLQREIQVTPHPLLAEDSIKTQDVDDFDFQQHKAFFQTGTGDLPFDIFSASFYLLSRYEEYLPHKKDVYGRFPHEESVAFKQGFLDQPLINIWAIKLAQLLCEKYPGTNLQLPVFRFLPTYDIDIAFSYKHKGFIRSLGGLMKPGSVKRLKVLAGVSPDPYESYDWLNTLHQGHQLQPRYFFLVARKNGRFDRHTLPRKVALRKLVRNHSEAYNIGIHPSWQSGDDHGLLPAEKRTLEEISGKEIQHSRQHYIRFNLPADYRRLVENGISDDYSMGYGSINGFRASVASSFYWYDLEKEAVTSLRIHPFCFMDANSFYEQKMSAAETFEDLIKYYQACKDVSGTLITIWHNHFLGSDPMFLPYREVYERFVEKISRHHS